MVSSALEAPFQQGDRTPVPVPKSIAFGDSYLHPSPRPVRQIDPLFPRLKRLVESLDLAQFGIAFQIDQDSEARSYPSIDTPSSFRVEITSSGAVVEARSEYAAIHAVSLLQQLRTTEGIPVVSIVDEPTYNWRGLMLDVARHFLSLEKIIETVDLMFQHRMNVLHLHLSDDQAFRFPTTQYPKLPSEPHYSCDELRFLVEYAADRAIRVIPELDVPGHTTSWVVAYPEWGSEQAQPSDGFGVHLACLDPSNPKVYLALKEIFREVIELFPDKYVHIGGDEVDPTWWSRSESVGTWMRRHKLAGLDDVHAAFNNRVISILNTFGKKVVSWDETLHQGLHEDTVIQCWRGFRARDAAVAAGFDCVVSSPYYLDLNYPADIHYGYEPQMSRAAYENTHKTNARHPRLRHVQDAVKFGTEFANFPELPNRSPGKVLGGEACMWSELVTSANLISRLWPRLAVLSERFWNGTAAKPFHEIYQAVTTGQPNQSLEPERNPIVALLKTRPALRLLFDSLEPVKWYSRHLGHHVLEARLAGRPEEHNARPYDLSSKLDAYIDYLPPENISTRTAIESIQQNRNINFYITGWQDQYIELKEALSQQPKLGELENISGALSRLAKVLAGEIAPSQQLVEPFGEYLLAPAWSVVERSIRGILSSWTIPDENAIEPIGRGLINDSYRVGSLLLQKVNTKIFSNVESIFDNERQIIDYTGDWIEACMPTKSESPFHKSSDGSYFRLRRFVEGRVFDVLPLECCRAAGGAFGSFLQALRVSDVPLTGTLPGLHDFDFHYEKFDSLNLTKHTDEAAYFIDYRARMPSYDQSRQPIHGDCKVSNLVFHPYENTVRKIIDLDTVMLGHPAWDFGDLIRSLCRGSVEELPWKKISEGVQGFFSTYPISASELSTFALAPEYIACVLALRYYNDHHDGDRYFKVAYRGENLERCRQRISLAQLLSQNAGRLKDVIQSSITVGSHSSRETQ